MSGHVRAHILARNKKQRRRRLMRKVFFVFVLVALLGGGGGYYLFSQKFKIHSVVISPVKRIQEADVRDYVDNFLDQKILFFIPKNYIWLTSSKDLMAGLKLSFSAIKDVRVEKDFPDGLAITIHEYDAWGVLCHGSPEECFWIDQEGIAFDNAPGFSGIIVPKIRDERVRTYAVQERQLSPELMRLIAFFNEKAVSDDALQSVQFTIAEKDQTLRVRTRLGWEILLLETTNPEDAYKNLQVALRNEIKDKITNLEYVDLRFGNRIFYKFRGQ